MNKLIDAAGSVIPTDDCACGRPKLATADFCCQGCPKGPRVRFDNHTSDCQMRMCTLGLAGFQVLPVPEDAAYFKVSPEAPETYKGAYAVRLETAQRKGAEARQHGASADDCPYTAYNLGPFRHAWFKGFAGEIPV